jgi:hypothetical protein
MSSFATSRAGPRPAAYADEAALYLAIGAALGASLLAAGWASGSARVGAVGGALAIIGVWLSWRTRDWSAGPRVALGTLGAVLAAGALQGLISWEVAQEVGMLYAAQGDVGLTLALRMSVLLVAFSFLLIRRDMLPFSLVPGVTLFGLAGGRGISAVAFGCFLVFLPAALAALGQAMLLSGIPARWRTLESPSDGQEGAPVAAAAPPPAVSVAESFAFGRSWRSRHWSLLGTLIAVIIALATLIYLPVYAYGTQYYWPLAMMSLPTGRFGFLEQRRTVDTYRSYSVGQGPVAPGQTPMLSFTAVAPPSAHTSVALWRGEVFDSYTGNAWRSTDEEPFPLRITRTELDVERFFPPTAPDALVTHEIRVEQDMPLVIYGAGQIQRAALPPRLATLIQGQIFVDKFGCVTAPGAGLPAGARYQVTSDTVAFQMDPRRIIANARRTQRARAAPQPSLVEAPFAVAGSPARSRPDAGAQAAGGRTPAADPDRGRIGVTPPRDRAPARRSLGERRSASASRMARGRRGGMEAGRVMRRSLGRRRGLPASPGARGRAPLPLPGAPTETMPQGPSETTPPATTLTGLEEVYLRIPLSSRRVADLARRLTANAGSTQEKIQALVSYLHRECIYTLTAPAVPTGDDAADFFLFTSKRGYCDLFSTAFAIMARSVGVPTRFVTGYAGGEYDPDLGRYVLRESDGHAWVEVYQPPFGWVAVDPTPGGGPVILSPLAQAIAAVQIFFRSHPWAWPFLGAVLLAAALAGLAVLLRRRTGQAQFALDRNDPRGIVLRAYARLTRALARRGRPRRPSQTPLEYFHQVERGARERAPMGRGRFAPLSTPHALTAVRALTDLFLLARYSHHPITPETAALALAHLTQASEALRQRRRGP